MGRGGARERAQVSPQAGPEQSGLCSDEDDALAAVDDFVAEKLGI
ncbi:hypothetical protein [Dysosmobacter sp.]|nr:hypothetical protein [Dysosmobacter sp.]MDY5509789.1 hypothetical protein [Dysosmobacter sp.]